ncbi:hypothetical protein CTAM01_11950 [Colletotrichum tamarilloi]|uniref:Uncharacterized protein n=1 Tax=Colletotrichum tamarilloi TaxID=1209934 RepID=A0ABQ9QW23_9PEZI|nr:uncharacterized protein CTAM01_11950 [Colletotrichum tamarilloi]KAK1487017.1 hypothetical protein CTAM01_11950 [Colletotrichum tamarilloi]
MPAGQGCFRDSTLDTRARSGAWKLGQTFARQWLMAAMLQHPSLISSKEKERNKEEDKKKKGSSANPSLTRERAQGLDDPAKGNRLLDGATKEND